MNYLVTGATGFIGGKLVTKLLEQGGAVHYLARKPGDHLPSDAVFHPWAPGTVPALPALSHIDAVFHLAGEPVAQRWTEAVKKRIYDSRIDGTRNLVSALAGLHPRPAALVSSSAVGYYGNRGDNLLTEASSPGDDFLAGVCVGWEREAFAASPLGIRVIAIRTATVLGAGGALPKMLPPFRLGLGAKFGNGRQWMSWIHVDDLLRLMLFAAGTATVSGPLNGSSPQPVTNATFTAALGHALHRPAALAVPQFALKLVMGEMSEFLFSSLRVIPAAPEAAGFTFLHPTLDGALQSVLAKD